MADMPWPGAVGVSGGGDSLALMHLLAGWARTNKAAPPLVLCVDHGLRKQSAGEARAVARWAKKLGLKCEILTVKTPKPRSDIEAWARAARLSLMGARLVRHRLTTLYLAHHQDDQAETFLLRLAQRHQVYLSAHTGAGNPIFQSRIAGLTRNFSSQGAPPDQASERAYAMIQRMIAGQASTLAYIDIISTGAIAVACLAPLVFIMKKPRRGAKAAAAH